MTANRTIKLPEITAGGAPAGQGRRPGMRLAVIAASVRKERQGRLVADWVAGTIPPAGPGADLVDLIDLAECTLPDDELLRPGGGERSPVADRIGAADGFVIVTPEYNHSYPASLKRLIDWHYTEWQFKAATVISYGVHGGLLATEHLRGVFAELSVVVTRRAVGLRAPWTHTGPAGYAPEPAVAGAVAAAIAELGWWAETLRNARRDRPFRG